MGHGVRRYTDLRAWQVCDTYKKAVYRICDQPPLARDWKLCSQLRDSVAGPPSNLAEGFGRFNPRDFAHYTVMARASLIESQNHLRDAVDRRHIGEERRVELDALAEAALEEVTGLMEYLQSPEALRNARLARERRIANRQQRRHTEPRTPRAHPRTPNPEPQTSNPEHRAANSERPNRERGTEPEHEPRSENQEE
jgi:four helix bundle protein